MTGSNRNDSPSSEENEDTAFDKEEPLTKEEYDSMPEKYQKSYDLEQENKKWKEQHKVSDEQWRNAVQEIARELELTDELSYEDVKEFILRNK